MEYNCAMNNAVVQVCIKAPATICIQNVVKISAVASAFGQFYRQRYQPTHPKSEL